MNPSYFARIVDFATIVFLSSHDTNDAKAHTLIRQWEKMGTFVTNYFWNHGIYPGKMG
jgi:hypothetical protein